MHNSVDTVTCIHQSESKLPGYTVCDAMWILKSEVPLSVCSVCPYRNIPNEVDEAEKPKKRIRGMGDVVSLVTKVMGIKKRKGCGCGSRQAKLNRLVPFSRSNTDRDWCVVVTTAPRPRPTLVSCVNSIRAAGWEPIVFAEPGSMELSDVETYWNVTRKGIWHNLIRSCRWALEKTKAKYILTVQDDSLFHPDSKKFVEKCFWPSPRCGFISLYTPKHYSTHHRKGPREPGVNKIVTGSLWGACALVWPRKVMEDFIAHKITHHWLGVRPRSGNKGVFEKRKNNPHFIQNSDTAIGRVLNVMRREMWFVDPSPVQHIAEHSTVAHGGNLGRRNCSRCAEHSIPLLEQVPLPKLFELE